MYALEVLQSLLQQQKALLDAISRNDPLDDRLIIFDLEYSKSRLPHHVVFKIQVASHNTKIFKCVVVEQAFSYACLCHFGEI